MTSVRNLFAGLLLLVVPAIASAQATVIVVRHAERADSSTDSPLSPAGETRAARLGTMLRTAGVSAIYTTERRRTIQTAQPLADALHLTPTVLKADDIDGLVTRVRAAGERDRILIVGHSNTLPPILQRLGATEAVTIEDDDYANLFVVVPKPGSTTLLRLRY